MAHELDLDPAKVLQTPWLWDEETVRWAQMKIDELRRPAPSSPPSKAEGET